MDRRKPIIALDFQNWFTFVHFIEKFNTSLNVKIGMEQYFSFGNQVIDYLTKKNCSIFLDLKLHDIPNTVEQAMKVLGQLPIDLVNVHASGGSKMMQAGLRGLQEGSKLSKRNPLLIAVTQLTSTSEEQMQKEQQILTSMEESVLHYATLTKASGLHGVVCSPLEAKVIKEKLGEDFLTVTPGIRLEKIEDDQSRVSTPYQAALLGSDYIVVGRPITKAKDPVQAYEKILKDWQKGIKEKGKSHDD